MTLRKLLIGGIFGLTLIGTTQGTSTQTPLPPDVNGNVVPVNYKCERHFPYKCYYYDPYQRYKPYRSYHPRYRGWAKHCREHPYSSVRCEKFCKWNKCAW